MNKDKHKLILIDNIQKVVEKGEQNLFRYNFACMSLDEKGKGWVYLDYVVPIIAEKFEVQTQTVRRKLWDNVKNGYATISEGRYFYQSQEKYAKAINAEYRNDLCARFTIEDFSSLIRTRAILEQILIEIGRKKGVMIARQTRQDQLLGSSPVTQRKYEKEIGIEVTPNYALIAKYDKRMEQEYSWQEGHIFVVRWGKVPYFARQLPNFYSPTQRICKPKYVGRKRNGLEKTPKPTVAKKRYFMEVKNYKAQKTEGFAYILTGVEQFGGRPCNLFGKVTTSWKK